MIVRYSSTKVVVLVVMDSYSNSAAPSGLPQPPELGLPRFRKKAGISLEQIVERTKISSRFLRAIENEEFDKLPGGIFTTSYLRQYAAAIGYDQDALLAYYNSKTNPQALPKGPHREGGSRSLLYRWLRTPAQAQR
jgi:transcriptional regulator with XRE-family HTH domain